MGVTLEQIQAAAACIRGQLERTPLRHSRTLSAITGAEIWLKFENLQFTASFKERGALNALSGLDATARARGVIAMSAGNHAQAVAYHGRRLGIPVVIVMPTSTPNVKVEHTRAHGAEVILHGETFDETRAFTRERAAQRGLTLVHPFDDDAVIAGQGTLALEMLEDGPGFDAVVAPIGGGGLLSGIATAVKGLVPATRVVGVQAARYPAAYQALRGLEVRVPGGSTVADGIAVKAPSARTLALLRRHVDEALLVEEDEIERAVFLLLEVEKTVVEGAGAAGLAAVLAHPERFAGQRLGLVLCGGNIDMLVLSTLLRRGLVRGGRLVRLSVEISDAPGALAALTELLGSLNSSIVEIHQERTFGASSVRATRVDLVLQLRGTEQAGALEAALRERGFRAALQTGL